MRKIRLTMLVILLLGMVGLSGVEIELIAESLPGLGDIDCFAMYGDYAIFAGGQHNLQVLDMHDPLNMEIVSWLDFTELQYPITSITIDENKAYLTYLSNFAIVSLIDPLAPVLLNDIYLGNGTLCKAVGEDILYVVTQQNESDAYVRSYSVADPLHLVLLDSLAIDGTPNQILCRDGVIVCKSYGLQPLVISTQNPAELISLGFHGLENGRITLEGNIMVCINNMQAMVFDLHNLSNPPGTISTTGDWPDQLFIHEDQFWFSYYTSYNNIQLMAIDISNPHDPVICYEGIAPNEFEYQVLHSENWLICKWGLGVDIRFADLDAVPVPQFDDSYQMLGIGVLSINDGLFAGMTRSGQISVLNVAADGSISQQRIIGSYFTEVMAVQDGLIFTAFPLRINNASSGELLSTLELEGEWSISQIVPAGQRVIVCAEGNEYHWYIIDISDPTQPTIAYRSNNDGYRGTTAVVEGNRLWIAGWSVLRCYDISNVREPQLLYADMLYATPYFLNPIRMIKRGDYLYMTTSQNVLACLSLDESGVQEITTQETHYHCYNIVPFGDGMVIGSAYRISVMSLTDHLHPQEVASAAVDSTGVLNLWDCIAVRDNLIFVGTGMKLLTFDGELALLLLSNPEPLTEYKLRVYPNPAVDEVNVVCKLNRSGKIRLELYNLRGQLVKRISRDNAAEGYNLLQLELKNNRGKRLAQGVYLIRLQADGTQQTAKLVGINSK